VTQKIIKDLQYIGLNKNYCTSNDKYIIFKYNSSKNITIFDIDNMRFICDIIAPRVITHESRIINNILYITARYKPLIFRYKISGEYVDSISFANDCTDKSWVHSNVSMINYEIIIVIENSVLFYDLDGNKIETLIMNNYDAYGIYVTPDHVYQRYYDKIQKYKRMLF
jgi:hypothetical protein